MAIQLKLSELLQSVPLASWKQRIVDIATAVGLKTENWPEGGFTRTLVSLFATFYTTSGDVVRLIAASHFLDFAKGPWLTLLAKQVYNVDRIEATYAIAAGGITLTNSGGGLFVFEPGDIVFANQASNATYRNSSGGSLTPGGTLTLDIIAEEAGSGSNALPGQITELVTTYLNVTCTNTIALVGLDEQSDPDLVSLCKASVAARSIGGVKKAYEFYAKTARRANGSPVGVTRVRIPPAIGDGTGTVYIAGAAGAITSPDVAVAQAVFDESVTHYGFTATAVSATNKSITAPCSVYIPVSLGLTEEEAQQKVLDALQSYVESLPIGGTVIFPGGKVYWRALLAVIGSAIPGTLQAQLVAETDISVAENEVPVWAGVLIDTSIYQV